MAVLKEPLGKVTSPIRTQEHLTKYRYADRDALICVKQNVNIQTGGLLELDGVRLAKNDVVLLTGQANKIENGLFTVQESAWPRLSGYTSTDGQAFDYKYILIETGTSAGRIYTVATDGYGIGMTAVEFIETALSPESLPGKIVIRDRNGRFAGQGSGGSPGGGSEGSGNEDGNEGGSEGGGGNEGGGSEGGNEGESEGGQGDRIGYTAVLNYNATQITLAFDTDPGAVSMDHITIGGSYPGSWNISGQGKLRILTLSSAASNYGVSSGSVTHTLTLKINYSAIDTKTITWTITRTGGSASFTSNSTWNLPGNTGLLLIQAIAKGGDGGAKAQQNYNNLQVSVSGGGGSSGVYAASGWMWVNPSSTPSVSMSGVSNGTVVITGAYSVTLSRGVKGGDGSTTSVSNNNGGIASITGSGGKGGTLSGAVSGASGSVDQSLTYPAGGSGGSWGTLGTAGNGGQGADSANAGTGSNGAVKIYYTTWAITGGDV